MSGSDATVPWNCVWTDHVHPCANAYHESHLCNDRLCGILLPLESQGHQVLIMAQLGSYWTTNDHQVICPTMWNLCVCAWLYLTMPEYGLTSPVLADHNNPWSPMWMIVDGYVTKPHRTTSKTCAVNVVLAWAAQALPKTRSAPGRLWPQPWGPFHQLHPTGLEWCEWDAPWQPHWQTCSLFQTQRPRCFCYAAQLSQGRAHHCLRSFLAQTLVARHVFS